MNKVQAAKTIIKLAKVLATDQKISRTAGAKYTLTEEKDYYKGHVLYQVKYADGTLGGWIESEKNLQGNAKVLDKSKVWGNAVVKDNAIVKGRSVIYGDAIISGNAIVEDSKVCDNASVSEHARILNKSYIEGNATVTDQATVDDSFVLSDSKVFNKARIANDSFIYNNSQVSGTVIHSRIRGKCIIKGKVKNCSVMNHVVEKNESFENQSINKVLKF